MAAPENVGVPAWAVPRVMWKLIVESIKHPNSGTAVIIDRSERTVKAVPLDVWTGAEKATTSGPPATGER